MRRARGRWWHVSNFLGALTIVVMLILFLPGLARTQSGIAVSVVDAAGHELAGPLVQVRRQGELEVLAANRAPAQRKLVFHLAPGSYVVSGRVTGARARARELVVRVLADQITSATLRFRAQPSRPVKPAVRP